MKKKITIIGSTGSIGTQALEVIEKISDEFEIIGLAAGSNIDLLNKQIECLTKTIESQQETLTKQRDAIERQNALTLNFIQRFVAFSQILLKYKEHEIIGKEIGPSYTGDISDQPNI